MVHEIATITIGRRRHHKDFHLVLQLVIMNLVVIGLLLLQGLIANTNGSTNSGKNMIVNSVASTLVLRKGEPSETASLPVQPSTSFIATNYPSSDLKLLPLTIAPSSTASLAYETSEISNSNPSLSPIVTISTSTALEATEPTVKGEVVRPNDAVDSDTNYTNKFTNTSANQIQTSHSINMVESKPTIQNQDHVLTTEFYHNQLFSPVCSVFFSMETILNDQDIIDFQSAAKQFLVVNMNEINLPVIILGVKDVTVVSQVMSWKRPSRLQKDAANRLDVYFRIDVVATGYATINELEGLFQELFDSSDDVFQVSFKTLGAGQEAFFNPTQMTLIVTAGCAGFVAIMFMSSILMWMKNSNSNQKPSPKLSHVEKYPKSTRNFESHLQGSHEQNVARIFADSVRFT